MNYLNGNKYEGGLKNYKCEGYGIFKFKFINSEFKGYFKKGFPIYGFLNLFNSFNYFLDNKFFEKYFLIKIIMILLNFIEILSKLNFRTYLHIFVFLISIIINF